MSTAPGATVTGAEGDDVIVATSAAEVTALGGNDTICVVGGMVDAGDGDDTVEVTSGSAGTGLETAHLGSGTTTYESPGGINDDVSTGGEGRSSDTVDLGDGFTDALSVYRGAGSDVVATRAPAPTEAAQLTIVGDTASWDVDLAGTVSRKGVQVGSFHGFGARTYLSFTPSARVAVSGTSGPMP